MNDVGHDIAPVRSGYSVTLVYHLYFESPIIQANIKQDDVHGRILDNTFQNLVDDSTFLRNGGELVFGLQREYSIKHGRRNRWRNKSRKLNYILDQLKGNNALLRDVCKRQGLNVQANLVYSTTQDFQGEAILCCKSANFEGEVIVGNEAEGERADILGNAEGRNLAGVNEKNDIDLSRIGHDFGEKYLNEMKTKSNEDICWVTELTELTQFSESYCVASLFTRGETKLRYVYGRGCLVVKIDKW